MKANKDASDPKVIVMRNNKDGSSSGESVGSVIVDRTDKGHLSYHFWAQKDESFTISVSAGSSSSSSDVLFYPRTQTVHVKPTGCPPPVPAFEGRQAEFIKGQVTPAVQGVVISVKDENDEEILSVVSDKKGRYSAGPLYDDQKYSLSAFYSGYHLVEEVNPKTNKKDGTRFKAFRLGELQIQVTMTPKNDDGTPSKGGTPKGLGQVLLSLSGENGFRINNLTDQHGVVRYVGLFPGSYFLRPLLKEYKFTPRSMTVDVGESDLVQKAFEATRVAYSVMGTVTSLNGEPEPRVVLEAIGTDDDGERPKRYEETVSDSNGEYRLRGLYPGYTYVVQTKKKPQIEKSSPPKHTIKVGRRDAENVDFTVFRAPQKFDITGVVNASSLWIDSLSIQLLDLSSSIKKETKVTKEMPFFEFPSVAKGEYILKCHSPLSKRTHIIDSEEVRVDVRSRHFHANMHFNAHMRKVDDSGAAGSVMSLLFGLIIFGGVVFFSELRSFVKSMTSSSSSSSSAKSRRGSKKSDDGEKSGKQQRKRQRRNKGKQA
mmetsp:Transcript_6613/g.12469  ORF Transcript_6613/g.12469 Transcript_6613/m.12469 type:complete len:541 (+) Transcript_6613:278-1900(+)